MTRRPHGHTLVELLVALPLAVLAAASAAVLLIRIARTARSQSAVMFTSRELRHAAAALAADLTPLGGRDVRIVSDSMIEFRAVQGVLLLCHRDATSFVVATPIASSDGWVAGVRAGDDVRLFTAPLDPTDAPAPVLASLMTAPEATTGGVCGADTSTFYPRRWRLQLSSLAAQPLAGTPFTVHRDVRYRHYRSGSEWWLGRQSRTGAQWDGLQPVAGPVLSAAARGVRFRAQNAAGQPFVMNEGMPDSLRADAVTVSVVLQMARRVREIGSTAKDSLEVTIPLHAAGARP